MGCCMRFVSASRQRGKEASKRRQHNLTCSPPGDHNGEDASINGEHGDEDVGGSGQGAHDVGPDTTAVHELHEQAQAALQQRAVLPGEHDLEVTLQWHTPASVERYGQPLHALNAAILASLSSCCIPDTPKRASLHRYPTQGLHVHALLAVTKCSMKAAALAVF